MGDQRDVVCTAKNSLFVDHGRPPEFPKVVRVEQIIKRPPFDLDRVGREDVTLPGTINPEGTDRGIDVQRQGGRLL